jgi:putative ABC transport system permease protein
MGGRTPQPPGMATRIIQAVLSPAETDEVLGDLHEAFVSRAGDGPRAARLWYWGQTALFAAAALAARLRDPFESQRRSLARVREKNTIRRSAMAEGVEVTTMWLGWVQTTRRLARDWRFSASMTLILGIGIGAGLVGYSVVDRVLLQPLPYERPDELGLLRVDLGSIASHPGISMAEVEDMRALEGVFGGVEAAAAERRASLMTGDGLESVLTTAVSSGMFDLLGVPPLLGRTFEESDLLDGPAGVVLSHAFWQGRLAGDPDVLGRTLVLDGDPRPVLGVMPEGFAIHMGKGANISSGIELWRPMRINPDFRNFWGYRTIVRLGEGTDFVRANAALEVLASRLLREYPDDYGDADLRFVAHPLHADLVSDARPSIDTALTGVALLLLVAFANGASLMLGRQRAREADLAVRSALGAERRRLIQSVLAESLVLAIFAALLGGILAAWGVTGLRRLDLPGVPRWEQLGIDWSFFVAGVALAAVGFLASGLYPALKVSRGAAWRMLRGETAYRGSRGTAVRRVLVGVQVALTVVILFGAAILSRSALRLAEVDLGFPTANALTMAVPTDDDRFDSRSARWMFHQELRERLLELQGVVNVGAVTHLPLSGYAPTDAYGSLDADSLNWDNQLANYFGVLPGYLETLGVELRQGRWIEDRDIADAAHVAVVDETLVAGLFPGEDPIGTVIKLGWGIQSAEIVGVIRHPRVMDPRTVVRPQVYVPQPIFGFAPLHYVIRTSGDPLTLANAVRSEVAAAGSGRAVFNTRTLDSYLAEMTSSLRLTLLLILLQALLTALLSCFGLFSVIGYLAYQTRRETAIRGALGATRKELLEHHLRWGGLILAGAVPVGVAVALGGAGLLESIVFDVSTRDTASVAVAAAVATLVGLFATYVPARGAARVDPMETLRSD